MNLRFQHRFPVHRIIALSQSRDALDWILNVAAIVAAIAAAAAFIGWWMQQRKRAEFEFSWQWSPLGAERALRTWPRTEPATFEVGRSYQVHFQVRNIGTAGGRSVLNLIVPGFSTPLAVAPGSLQAPSETYRRVEQAEDAVVDYPPNDAAHWVEVIFEDIGPGVSAGGDFVVRIDHAPSSPPRSGSYYVGVSVENGTLNNRGKLRLRLKYSDPSYPWSSHTWPDEGRRRVLGTLEPPYPVRHAVGRRIDRRPFIVVASSGQTI